MEEEIFFSKKQVRDLVNKFYGSDYNIDDKTFEEALPVPALTLPDRAEAEEVIAKIGGYAVTAIVDNNIMFRLSVSQTIKAMQTYLASRMIKEGEMVLVKKKIKEEQLFEVGKHTIWLMTDDEEDIAVYGTIVEQEGKFWVSCQGEDSFSISDFSHYLEQEVVIPNNQN